MNELTSIKFSLWMKILWMAVTIFVFVGCVMYPERATIVALFLSIGWTFNRIIAEGSEALHLLRAIKAASEDTKPKEKNED